MGEAGGKVGAVNKGGMTMKRIIGLLIIFFFAFPLASIAGEREPAWWTQKKIECGISTSYNTWVDDGSPCNKGGGGGGSSGGLSSGQELGTALGQALGNAIADSIRKNNEEAAIRAAQEKARAEEERRRQEEETIRKHDEIKNRLLGGTLNVGESSQLGLMGAETGTGLSLMIEETPGHFGQKTELKPIIGDNEVTGAIKLDKDDKNAEKDSAKARKRFDTAGKLLNTGLPAEPSVPSTKPVSPTKIEKISVLKNALKKNEDEEKALEAQLEKFRQSPEPDETAMKDLQTKITAKEDEKKKIEKEMEDLTATE